MEVSRIFYRIFYRISWAFSPAVSCAFLGHFHGSFSRISPHFPRISPAVSPVISEHFFILGILVLRRLERLAQNVLASLLDVIFTGVLMVFRFPSSKGLFQGSFQGRRTYRPKWAKLGQSGLGGKTYF